MKSFSICVLIPFFIQYVYATPAAINERDVAATNITCLVDQLTPQGQHISHSGSCGTSTNLDTMALSAPVCGGGTRCIVPRTDCLHPGGGKCIHWTEKCSVGTYTLGKENDVCPQNLRCCEGTISAFEDTTQIESILNHQKQWKRPWKAHSDHHEHCSDKDTTAQAKIINSKPKAKAAAAKAVKKILHKAAHKDGPIHHHSPEEYWGEHADLVKIWRQVLHLLETPEGQAPKIVS